MTDLDGGGYTSNKIMSVNLTPLSARAFSVGEADDPYKKYWWAILAGFIVTGAWLCFPLMETPVGSIRADATAKPAIDAAGSEQSLDSVDNPGGAPGGVLDGASGKSGDDMTSMLYQAAPEAGAAAAGKPLGDAKASLAQQLKDTGKKTDASGWAEKAQRGFNAPHLAGGLSGAGSVGGGSGASAGSNFFGSQNARVGFGSTHGLGGGGSDSADLKALKASAGAAAANLKGSNESMHAGAGQAFDGGKGKGSGPIGAGAMAQANAALDAAPDNLKTSDPKIDPKKPPDPPAAAAAAPPASSGNNLGEKLVEMAATAAIGGLIGGVGGQMVMMMGTQLMQQQQQQQAAAAAAQQQSTVNGRYGSR